INTGACISSIEALGPGRYDIKMIACPRVGALTSMWVYSWFTLNDGTTQQNEIDIEIGLEPDFSQVFFTTWTAPSNNTNMPTPVDFAVNDGDWHIYSFDWVTDVEIPYVDYYIDGKKVLTIKANVPTTNATLNIGMWVPSWSGGGVVEPDNGNISKDSRMYDTDYAEISWWRYIPFQMGGWEQRPVQNRNYADGYVPKTLTSLPIANKCANGDFERDDYGNYGNP
ncbi:MAG: glycoside hydrolase family 16 protein, partial [Clostridiales bacterium]|nr:glycoside hydrolase family 16 protein [Clostridiales bacterium]